MLLILVSACTEELDQPSIEPSPEPEPSVPQARLEPSEPRHEEPPPVTEEAIEDEEDPYELPDGIEFVFDEGGEAHRSTVVEAIRLANQKFGEVFGIEVTRARVFVFAEIGALEQSVTEFLNEPAQHLNIHEGVAAQAWPRSIGIYTGMDEPTREVMAHELFHVLQHQLVHADGFLMPLAPPAWLAEGSAEYAITLLEEGMAEVMQSRHVWCVGSDTSLAALEDPPGRTIRPLDYCHGFNATSLLAESSGAKSIVDFWARRGEGDPWMQAFEKAFGRTPNEFYEEFDQWNATALQHDTDSTITCEIDSPDTVKSQQEATDVLELFFVGPTEPREVIADGVPAGARGYRFVAVGIKVWQDLTHEELTRALILPDRNVGWGQAGRRAENEIVVFMGPWAAPGTYRVGLELPDGRMADTEFEHPC